MTRILLFISFLIFVFQVNGQTAADTTIYLETDNIHVDTPAQFKGGTIEFVRMISSQLIFIDDTTSGTVVFEYVIEKDGSPTNVRIIKGLHPSFDQGLIHTISKSPRWKPASKDNLPVRVKKRASIDLSRTETSETHSKKKKNK